MNPLLSVRNLPLRFENNLVTGYILLEFKEYDGDTYFPELENKRKPVHSEKHFADERHICDFTYLIFEKAKRLSSNSFLFKKRSPYRYKEQIGTSNPYEKLD